MAIFNSANNSYQTHNHTLFEAVVIADPFGNIIGPANPSGMAVDAFGRARVATPFTLFDSSHRFRDNNLWSTSNTSTATYSHNVDAGSIELNLDTTSGAEIVRETTKIFSYQPGKSLQIINTVVFNAPKPNLRQRVGYFGVNNGIYLEANGNTVYLVERSYTSGAVNETRVPQSQWNVDAMDGSGVSNVTLDISKGQIFFIDIEWLGLGSVRCGFVINGIFCHAHSFHHANILTSPYMTTASLPCRYEIKNLDTTASNSTLKQICTSVISEGGYELRGLQQSVSTDIVTPRTLTTAGTTYPLISLRLKTSPDRLDAIAILSAISLLAITNNVNYKWSVVASGTTTGGTWVSAGTDSALEYNITGTGFSGGRILANGFTSGSNQSSESINILKEALFSFQLERNGLTSTPYEITLCAVCSTNSGQMHASLDWEEISR